jgi:hypothetical protein
MIHRLPPSEGRNGDSHLSAADCQADEALAGAGLDGWPSDEALRQEMERLVAANQELLVTAGLSRPAESCSVREAPEVPRELAQLRAENARLRTRIEALEEQLQVAVQGREQTWAEQQREYEALLEEKSEVIRSLHLKVQDLQSAESSPTAAQEQSGDALADKQELETLRQQLEQERCQLAEDAEALEAQMKHMEMAMSRERVELARQRSELQRLHSDFKHELEMASRDEKLRERLAPLQRRHQEVVSAKGGAAPPARPTSAPQLQRPATMAQLQRPASAAQLDPANPGTGPASKKPASGLLRRLFGGRA